MKFGGTAATNVAVLEQYHHHGDKSSGNYRSGDRDSNGQWTHRKFGEWVYLHG